MRASGSLCVPFWGYRALALPVEDGRFDAATIAFGMRNLADYRQGFAELRRAVRPGGRVVCLEIARPRSRLGRAIQAWFDRIVPVIGRAVGQGSAYAYLVQSTRAYPAPEQIAVLMVEAGQHSRTTSGACPAAVRSRRNARRARQAIRGLHSRVPEVSA